jgi:hypothetical protein
MTNPVHGACFERQDQTPNQAIVVSIEQVSVSDGVGSGWLDRLRRDDHSEDVAMLASTTLLPV